MLQPLAPGWYRLLFQRRLFCHSHPLLAQRLGSLLDSWIYCFVCLSALTVPSLWGLVAYLLEKAQPNSLINQNCYLLWIRSAYLRAECLRTFANYLASWVWTRSILVVGVCPWWRICYCYSSLPTCHCFWIQLYRGHILLGFWTSCLAPQSLKYQQRYFEHSPFALDSTVHTLICFPLMIHDPSVIFIVACYRHFAYVCWNRFDLHQTSYHFETIQTYHHR